MTFRSYLKKKITILPKKLFSKVIFFIYSKDYMQNGALADPRLRLSPAVKGVEIFTSPIPADGVAYYSKQTDVLEVVPTWTGQIYFVAPAAPAVQNLRVSVLQNVRK